MPTASVRNRIAASVAAVLIVGAGAAGRGVQAHGGVDQKADAACQQAIQDGYYLADMADQCADDYNDAGRP